MNVHVKPFVEVTTNGTEIVLVGKISIYIDGKLWNEVTVNTLRLKSIALLKPADKAVNNFIEDLKQTTRDVQVNIEDFVKACNNNNIEVMFQ